MQSVNKSEAGCPQRLRIVTEDGREISLGELLERSALPAPPKYEYNPLWSEMLRDYKNGSGTEIMGGIHYGFSVTDTAGNRT